MLEGIHKCTEPCLDLAHSARQPLLNLSSMISSLLPLYSTMPMSAPLFSPEQLAWLESRFSSTLPVSVASAMATHFETLACQQALWHPCDTPPPQDKWQAHQPALLYPQFKPTIHPALGLDLLMAVTAAAESTQDYLNIESGITSTSAVVAAAESAQDHLNIGSGITSTSRATHSGAAVYPSTDISSLGPYNLTRALPEMSPQPGVCGDVQISSDEPPIAEPGCPPGTSRPQISLTSHKGSNAFR